MSTSRRRRRLSPLAAFVSRRITELQGRLSQREIAERAGFNAANMLSMVRTGDAKLALDRVVDLARALECDERQLMRLALQDHHGPELVAAIERSMNEVAAPGVPDRPSTAPADPSVDRKVEIRRLEAVSIALRIEAGRAHQEIGNARKLARASLTRVERVEKSLVLLRDELAQALKQMRPVDWDS